jgi:hypothetical protein
MLLLNLETEKVGALPAQYSSIHTPTLLILAIPAAARDRDSSYLVEHYRQVYDSNSCD